MKRIPPHARKVFSGIIFNVWQWDQEMFDGTIKVFEMLERADSAIIIPRDGNKFLIQEEEHPGLPIFLTFPAGQLEDHDSDLETLARRELREETGYIASKLRLIKSFEPVNKIQWTVNVYVAEDLEKVGEPDLDGGEKIHSTNWLSFDEMLDSASDSRFRLAEIKMDMIHAKSDPVFREEYKKLLFGDDYEENKK
jgi:ADP-ribose pyrophosphatase